MNLAKWRKLAGVILLRYKFLSYFLIFFLLHVVNSYSLEKSQHEEWINKIGAKKISLIFASGYLGNPASSFGHTFLKLSNPKNQGGLELIDYGINYAARTGEADGAIYALYGLFGYFPGAFGLLPYHQMIKEYTNLEGRDLWEYELNFSEEEVKTLLKILLQEEDKTYDYYFLTDNCSYRILWLLQRVRPSLQFFQNYKPYVIPLDTVKDLIQQSELVTKITYRPSLMTKYENQKIYIKRNVKNLLTEELTNEELDFKILAETLLNPSSEKVYQLSAQRAKRGGQSQTIHRTQPQAPHLGSDSRLLGLGYFQNNSEIQKQKLYGYELKFRFAFHDLLSNPLGAPRWSLLEIISFKLKIDQQSHSYLKNFTLIDIFSSHSIDEYFFPISWGFKIGSQYDEKTRRHFEDLQIKIGYAWDFDQNQNHQIFLGGVLEEGEILNAGMQLLLLNQWTEKLRTQISIKTFESHPQLGLRYNLNRNLEVYLDSQDPALGLNWLF
jgi:hypothetical protein